MKRHQEPAHYGYCCSTVEQMNLGKSTRYNRVEEGQMGWSVSQTEQLIGLARRDIQRSCYQGQGGVNLVTPEISTWGYRVYQEDHLALLFLAACAKQQGLTLPEASRHINEARAQGSTIPQLLTHQADVLADRFLEVKGQLIRARALQAALSPADRSQHLEHLVERTIGESLADASASVRTIPSLAPILAAIAQASRSQDATESRDQTSNLVHEAMATTGLGEQASCAALLAALDTPGLDLAIELWLGQGGYASLRDAVESHLGQTRH